MNNQHHQYDAKIELTLRVGSWDEDRAREIVEDTMAQLANLNVGSFDYEIISVDEAEDA